MSAMAIFGERQMFWQEKSPVGGQMSPNGIRQSSLSKSGYEVRLNSVCRQLNILLAGVEQCANSVSVEQSAIITA